MALTKTTGALDRKPDALAFATVRPTIGLLRPLFKARVFDLIHRTDEQLGKGNRIGSVGTGRQNLIRRNIAT